MEEIKRGIAWILHAVGPEARGFRGISRRSLDNAPVGLGDGVGQGRLGGGGVRGRGGMHEAKF